MRMKKKMTFMWLTTCAVGIGMTLSSWSVKPKIPVMFLMDGKRAAALKEKSKFDAGLKTKVATLAAAADKLVDLKIQGVMDKKMETPCGNKHEYMSMARYFWPDPKKPDGKPFIKRDGEKSPAVDLVKDNLNLENYMMGVNTLGWAYYMTGDPKYANKAISMIRFWFLDTATMMLPNLNHAQIITGKDTGRGTGLIDTRKIPYLLDGIALLRTSDLWTAEMEKGVLEWTRAYMVWFQNSKNGKEEGSTHNNHRTYYDSQLAALALFCGEDKLAQKIFDTSKAIIAHQFEPDGKQPLELARTLPMHYSSFNLNAWIEVASLAEKKNVDLMNYSTEDGRGLKKGIDFLIPYMLKEKPWPYKEIHEFHEGDFVPVLLKSAFVFHDDNYRKIAEKITFDRLTPVEQIMYSE